PGGFGEDGVRGKIAAVTYAREHHIPYFGICFGMQVAVIEMVRNLLGVKDATSSEFSAAASKDIRGPVVGLMTEWKTAGKTERRSKESDLGGTMRLGAYPCVITPKTLALKIYGVAEISERHRHRYEVNLNYADALAKQGVVFSGLSPDGRLPEIVELKNHPFFIGVQFHPEFKSRPFAPHPIFAAFIKAAKENKRAEPKLAKARKQVA
ncbi:MAG: glutamine amidotransferase-related protein, partial [Alphaproteobacteria bacterium]